MEFDAFISYSHQDKPVADAACASLEAAGIRCWIAPRDIVPGRDWGESIIDAIAGAKVVILIFSGHANASPQIKREVERGVNRGIPIVPVRIEDIAPSKSLEYFISTPHWLDAFTPPLEQHLRQLAVAVQALLHIGPDAGKPAADVAPALAAPPAQRLARRSLMIAAAAVAVTAAVAISVTYYLVHGFGQQDLVRTIVTGVNKVDSVAVSPDGTRIASGNWGGSIQISNFKDGRLIQNIAAGHVGISVPFSPDGSRIATASDTKNVRIVDAVSGQTFRTFTGHTAKVMTVAFSPDGKHLASTSEDRTIKIWDVESGQLLRTLEGHGGTVQSVAFFPDGKRIVSGSHDETVRVWNAETGEAIFKFTEPTSKVLSVAISPDGKWIAAGGVDGVVRGWDAVSGQALSSLITRSGVITSIAFSPDGQRIASAGYDGTLSISDAKTGKLIRNLMHPAPLAAVKFSPDGKWVVTGADDMSVRIWRAP